MPAIIIFIIHYGFRQPDRYNRRFIIAFIIILSLNTYLSLNKFRPFVKDYYQTQEYRYLIGWKVDTLIPKSERIISGDIGMIGYTAINHRFTDMVGLTSKANPDRLYGRYNGNDWLLSPPKYIADTVTPEGKYPRLPGNTEIIYKYIIPGKPYAIALLKRKE